MACLRHRSPDKVLAVVPVYGHAGITHDLLVDLERERDLVDVVVVDNRGDYRARSAESVVRPGRNLGWAGGTNYGTRQCVGPEHTAALWLNNDTRLSHHFVAGLVRCWQETGAAIVGPLYDCHWVHQRARRPVAVDRYRPRDVHFRAPFIDGTAMLVPTATIDAIGLLDAETFAPVGWGAEIDFGLRATDAGLTVAVTALAYLHHNKSTTAKTVFPGGIAEYAELGYPVAMEGLERNWGVDWRHRAGIDATTGQTEPPRRSTRLRRSSASRLRSSRSL